MTTHERKDLAVKTLAELAQEAAATLEMWAESDLLAAKAQDECREMAATVRGLVDQLASDQARFEDVLGVSVRRAALMTDDVEGVLDGIESVPPGAADLAADPDRLSALLAFWAVALKRARDR
jgi:hypothetical protein